MTQDLRRSDGPLRANRNCRLSFRRRISGVSGDLFGSGRETLAALHPATSEDLAAILGGHARAKTVGARTLEAAWLKGTFHGVDRPLKMEFSGTAAQ